MDSGRKDVQAVAVLNKYTNMIELTLAEELWMKRQGEEGNSLVKEISVDPMRFVKVFGSKAMATVLFMGKAVVVLKVPIEEVTVEGKTVQRGMLKF